MEDKQARLAKEPFEAEDLLRLFVDPQDRAVLCRTWDLVEPAGTVQELYVRTDNPGYATSHSTSAFNFIKFHWTQSSLAKGFYVPYAVGSGVERPAELRQDAPKDVVQRFEAVTHTLTDIHWRFSRVKAVFQRLNQESVCRTPGAMRYVWPCIHTLANKAGLLAEAEATREPRERLGGNVWVPTSLINELKETNDTVLRAQFLDDVEPTGDVPIKYEMIHWFVTH